MKICILGDFSPDLDEGYKNTSHSLANYIEKTGNDVYRTNMKSVGNVDFWRRLKESKADIIHTIAQPTTISLIFTHLLRDYFRDSRTVLSALRPESYFPEWKIKQYQRVLVRLTRPDLVLTQSIEAEQLFLQLDCNVSQIPTGVDLEQFMPVTQQQKRQLRVKYKLPQDQTIILHVGHLKHNRNLIRLEPLQRAGYQVLIAGSTYMGTDNVLINKLKSFGFIVFTGYQPSVEELYMLSDCYVFPVLPGNSLSLPLSILEAMACNLPVVSTRFRGLENYFEDGQGLVFVDSPSEIQSKVQEIINSKAPPVTRKKVQSFSWRAISRELMLHYEKLLTL